MNRRTFMMGASTILVAPLAAEAQPAQFATIGFLGAGTRSAWGHRVARFEQRLHELGWIKRRNVAIEYHWADGRTERLAGIAPSSFASRSM
jgi:putative ABC transport system substrate-binding protein